MSGSITQDELDEIRAAGGTVTMVPKKVEVDGLKEFTAHFHKMAHEQHEQLIQTINNLVAVINEKEFKGTDVSGLIKAVMSLKQDVSEPMPPIEWQVDFERDPQTRLLKSGIRFSPIQRVLN